MGDPASKNRPRSVGHEPHTRADRHGLAFCLGHCDGLNMCVQIPMWEPEPSAMVSGGGINGK